MLKFFVIFTLFITYINALEPQTTKEVTLALPWKHQFQFAGYYMAKELGYYKKAGLYVNIKESEAKKNIPQEVASNYYEFGISHSSVILDKIKTYPNLLFLNAIHQSSPLILLSKKRDDIKTLQDLKDKKITMSDDKTLSASINAMLSSVHSNLADLKVVKNDFKLKSLINGDVDLTVAYSSNEPFILEQKGIEYTIFDPKDYGYDFYSDILFTNTDMLKNSKQVVDNFTHASLMGWQYAYEHIDETVNTILKKYNTQGKTKAALLFEAKTLKKLAYQGQTEFGDINTIRLREIITSFRLLGFLKENRRIDLDSFLYVNRLKYQNQNKKKSSLLIKFLEKYKQYLRILLLIIILIVLMSLYYRHKMKSLLLKQSEELNKNLAIFDKNISTSRTDLYGKITYVSEAFCSNTGYSRDELIGKNHNILKDKMHNDSAIYKDLWMTIKSGHTWSGEFKNISKDGSSYWVKTIISPIFDTRKNIIGYEGIREDITKHKLLESFNEKLEEEIQNKTHSLTKLANTDKLTGIYNRVKIDEELEKSFRNFTKGKENFSIILIDIDFFKNVNDTYGHQIGDHTLQTLANVVESKIRSTDIFGRWGGEEFLIICPNTSVDAAYKLAEKIRLAIEIHKFAKVKNLTISIGIADIKETLTIDKIIYKTDEALYKAKENGRNRVEGL